MTPGKDVFDAEVEEKKQGYRKRIQQLQDERDELETILPVLKEKYEIEKKMAERAWGQAERNVEERRRQNTPLPSRAIEEQEPKQPKTKPYTQTIKYGLDRVRKAQILHENGVTPIRDLLLTNQEIWRSLKDKKFYKPDTEGMSDDQKKKAFNDWGDTLRSVIDTHTALAIRKAGFKDHFAYTDQLEEIEGATHDQWKKSAVDMGWTYFHTKGYRDVPKEEPLDYKIYASLENITNLNKQTIEALFKALSNAGYVGGLKTARLPDSAVRHSAVPSPRDRSTVR